MGDELSVSETLERLALARGDALASLAVRAGLADARGGTALDERALRHCLAGRFLGGEAGPHLRAYLDRPLARVQGV